MNISHISNLHQPLTAKPPKSTNDSAKGSASTNWTYDFERMGEPSHFVRRRTSSTHCGIDFTKEFDGSDVVFKVGGKRVYAVSAVLRVASKELGELMRKQGTQVDLSHNAIEHADFCELMAMLHPVAGKIHRINDQNIYRLLPLIRLFGMSALQDECEEYLMTLSPELRHLALANEYNFNNLEEHVLHWASGKTFRDLESDPDWGLVTMEQRQDILEKIVRRYERTGEKTVSSVYGSELKRSRDIESKPSGKPDIDKEHFDKILKANDNLVKDMEKLTARNKQLMQKYDRNKTLITKVSGIIHGKPNTKTLPICCSVAKEKHFSGTEDKCSSCRNYMVGQIKQLLPKPP